MDETIKEQLARSMFRFKKASKTFYHGLDVNMSEIAVMNWIQRNSDAPGNTANISEIQSSICITKPAISQIYRSLEKKGYILRKTDVNDRRKVVVTLTPKGHEILLQMKKDFETMLDEIVVRLGEEDTRTMITLFNRFADISENIKRR